MDNKDVCYKNSTSNWMTIFIIIKIYIHKLKRQIFSKLKIFKVYEIEFRSMGYHSIYLIYYKYNDDICIL